MKRERRRIQGGWMRGNAVEVMMCMGEQRQ